MTAGDADRHESTETAETSGATRDETESGSDSDALDRTGPLADLAATVTDREAGTGPGIDSEAGTDGSSPAVEELFDRESVTDIDSDRLWERLTDDAVDEPVRSDEREVREIDKGSYCHQCEHFAAPPTVACTREGTEILELTSVETFRVADCPVVLEDEALGGRAASRDCRETGRER